MITTQFRYRLSFCICCVADRATLIVKKTFIVGTAVLLIAFCLLQHETAARSIWLSSTDGTSSKINEYAIPSGELLFTFDVPVSSVDGLAYDQNGSLWLLTEDGGRILEYSRDGTLLDSSDLPDEPRSLEGLSWFDGNLLIASPGGRLFIEVETNGIVLRSVPMEGGVDYAGMAANFGRVFAAGSGQSGQLSELDPTTLSIISSRPMPSNRSVGLAFDGQFVWANLNGELVARDIGTLDVVHSFPIVDSFTEGVAVEIVPEPTAAALLLFGVFAFCSLTYFTRCSRRV